MALGIASTRIGAFAAASTAIAICLACATQTVAQPAQQSRIGIVGPLSDYFSIIGDQIRSGAAAAINEREGVAISVADDECSAEGGANSAREMVEAGVSVVIGYPCIEAFDTAMPILAEAGITLIAIGTQAEGITAHTKAKSWPLLRLAPSNTQEAEAIAGYLAGVWRSVNFAIIDDGTLYGRQLAEAVRFQLEEDNLRPVFTDTYRPQMENQVGLVRRLNKAGATHVFIGGDAFDASVISANAEMIEVPLTIAGGSALIGPPEDGKLADDTIVTGFPDWSRKAEALVAIQAMEGSPLGADGYVLPAYAAAQIAIFGIDISADDGIFPYQRMLNRSFETVIGPLRFRPDGELEGNLFEVFTIFNGRMEPVEAGQ